MNLLFLCIGISIGLLINHSKVGKVIEKIKDVEIIPKKAQFIEPISLKEKFDKAKSVDDILN
jgi:hypothetical protein